LAGVKGIRLFSLQKGEAAEQARRAPGGLELIDPSGELRDFADTAALLAGLDLVISIDTVVAHLAGAMGKPVWLLLRFDGEWRWLTERQDSPWYPGMRIFRQERPGDWGGVLRRVAKALAQTGADGGAFPACAP
jgi:ADP-heptose:LPS heptosyltransferase